MVPLCRRELRFPTVTDTYNFRMDTPLVMFSVVFFPKQMDTVCGENNNIFAERMSNKIGLLNSCYIENCHQMCYTKTNNLPTFIVKSIITFTLARLGRNQRYE